MTPRLRRPFRFPAGVARLAFLAHRRYLAGIAITGEFRSVIDARWPARFRPPAIFVWAASQRRLEKSMFESLSDRLSGVFDRLRGRGALNEADVRGAMREVRIALLEAD